MQRFTSPLRNLKVASPCSQDWNAMIGSDRQRFCGACEMNVYNLSGMTRDEAESLIASAEGRLCVRFYRRADGSVITKNCPVGFARVKARAKVIATAFASLIFTFFGAIGIVSMLNSSRRSQVVGEFYPDTNFNRRPDTRQEVLMGTVAIERTPVPETDRDNGAANTKRRIR